MHLTAKKVVKILQDKGFEAYFLGGCVRDLLLKKTPADFDIATSAHPEEIKDVFKKHHPIGEEFGVMLVEKDGHHFEVATFRAESDYIDGRRPTKVHFCKAEQDALRRDFTINGIFYDPISEKYLDFIGGKQDLKRGLLRFIGTPEKRVQEDFLRLLRAVRFKNRFDLAYEHDTREVLSWHASLVIDISAERIRDELNKIIVHVSRKKALEELKLFGILSHIIPEITVLENTPQSPNHHSEGNVWNHSLLVLENIPMGASLELYWAALFHDLGKAKTYQYSAERISFPSHAEVSFEIAGAICKRLKFPKKSTQKIQWLVGHHHWFDMYGRMKLSTRLEMFDHPNFPDLIALHRADILGSIPEEEESRRSDLERLETTEHDVRFAREKKILPSQKEELLTGNEIMEVLEIMPGEEVGKIKMALREAQLEGEIHTKADAINWINKI